MSQRRMAHQRCSRQQLRPTLCLWKEYPIYVSFLHHLPWFQRKVWIKIALISSDVWSAMKFVKKDVTHLSWLQVTTVQKAFVQFRKNNWDAQIWILQWCETRLSTVILNKAPGLARIMQALRCHKMKCMSGLVSPTDAFKKPLWQLWLTCSKKKRLTVMLLEPQIHCK